MPNSGFFVLLTSSPVTVPVPGRCRSYRIVSSARFNHQHEEHLGPSILVNIMTKQRYSFVYINMHSPTFITSFKSDVIVRHSMEIIASSGGRRRRGKSPNSRRKKLCLMTVNDESKEQDCTHFNSHSKIIYRLHSLMARIDP